LTGTAPWTLAWSDGFAQTNILTNSVTRNVSPAASTNYIVSNVSDATCSGPGSGNAAVMVDPVPTCSISGETNVCPNSNGHSYTVSSSLTNSTFNWSISGNGSIVGATNGSAITVDAAASGSFTLTVTVSNTGCTNSCQQTVAVSDSTPPNAFCKDITIQLNATGQATILPADVDNGSSDACGTASLSLSK